jgi:general secretion pathway protein E/type IV pilus assembly protein PilB
MNRSEKDVHDELLRLKLSSGEMLDKAFYESKKEKIPFLLYLLENKIVGEEDLFGVMSRTLNLRYMNLNDATVDELAVRAVPVRVAWHYEFMPISLELGKLTIAVSVPLSIRSQDEIRLSLGYEIIMVLAKRNQILQLLRTYYGIASDTVDKIVGHGEVYLDEKMAGHESIDDIAKMAEDASIIRLVNQIILEAFRKRATDIHIEPYRGKLALRYRVDGKLQDQAVPEDFNRFLSPILSRIKIMANLNIVEKRVPQDGRAIVRIQEQVLDLRVSFMPTPHGENVVIRILPSKRHFSLEKLGLLPDGVAIFDSLLKKASGIVFVTGPTGSGKTTTLYACMERMNSKDKKILTIEDPIEYELDGVVQIQVNPDVGLTFARGLRSMLRQDPDVMMVGEVRDKETAEIAIRVALTGHLVLSTIHTNDAVSGITRLVDIGIKPYLIASTIQAFIAQRLVRVLCQHCKTEDNELDEETKARIAQNAGLASIENVRLYKAKGCEKCDHSGFYGRTAIYEILVFDSTVRRMVSEERSLHDIKRWAVESGMRTLMQNGVDKVLAGVTTFGEVVNVCQDYDLGAAVEDRKDDDPDTSRPAYRGAGKVPFFPLHNITKDNRIYRRFKARIPVVYKLIKKAEGNIIMLNTERLKADVAGKQPDTLFGDNLGVSAAERKLYDIRTETINIGAGGMSIESIYRIPVGSILDFTLELPGADEPVQGLAKVVRTEKDLPKCFLLALCFLDMSKSDRVKVEELCAKKAESAE